MKITKVSINIRKKTYPNITFIQNKSLEAVSLFSIG